MNLALRGGAVEQRFPDSKLIRFAFVFKKKKKRKFESKVRLVSEHQLVLNTIVLMSF